MVLTSSRRYHHGMHDTGKVFFSFFWWKVVCALRSQRNGDCFSLLEGFKNPDDRTQSTAAWCLSFSKFWAKSTEWRGGRKGHKTKTEAGGNTSNTDSLNHCSPKHQGGWDIKVLGLAETGAHVVLGHGVEGFLHTNIVQPLPGSWTNMNFKPVIFNWNTVHDCRDGDCESLKPTQFKMSTH